MYELNVVSVVQYFPLSETRQDKKITLVGSVIRVAETVYKIFV